MSPPSAQSPEGVDTIVEDVPDFREESTNLESNVHGREQIRTKLAYLILALIAVLTLSIAWGVMANFLEIEEAKDLTLALLAPITSIFAAIIGFYYGHETR